MASSSGASPGPPPGAEVPPGPVGEPPPAGPPVGPAPGPAIGPPPGPPAELPSNVPVIRAVDEVRLVPLGTALPVGADPAELGLEPVAGLPALGMFKLGASGPLVGSSFVLDGSRGATGCVTRGSFGVDGSCVLVGVEGRLVEGRVEVVGSCGADVGRGATVGTVVVVGTGGVVPPAEAWVERAPAGPAVASSQAIAN